MDLKPYKNCKLCKKHFSSFKDFEFEDSNVKQITENIRQHVKNLLESNKKDHHIPSIISYFVAKLYRYLIQVSDFRFSAEKLAEMFYLFQFCIDSQKKYDRLNPGGELTGKKATLDLEARLLECYEARGFLKEAKSKLRFFGNMVEDGLYDNEYKLIIPIYMILVNLAKANIEDEYFMKFIPLVKLAKKWLWMKDESCTESEDELLEGLADWSYRLLKKAESSDIDLDSVVDLCCSTLTLFMDSPFKQKVFKVATTMCDSLFKSAKHWMDVQCILDSIKDTGPTFCKVALYYAWQGRGNRFSKELTTYLKHTGEEMKGKLHVSSILRLCSVGLLLSESDPFEDLLRTLEENVRILETTSNNLSMMKTKQQDFNIDALLYVFFPLAASIDLCMLPQDGTIIEKFSKSTVRPTFDVLCEQLRTNKSYVSKWCGNDNKASCVSTVALVAIVLSIMTDDQKFKERKSLFKTWLSFYWCDSKKLRNNLETLYDISQGFKKNNKIEEAVSALNVCCEAPWEYIKQYAKQLSQTYLEELLSETCTRAAQLLDSLKGKSSFAVIRYLLRNWFDINDDSRNIPAFTYIVKTWVEIQCKLDENEIDENDDSTLYSMVKQNIELSERNALTLLEQELMAYVELAPNYPDFCGKRKKKIMCFLLQHVYTADIHFQTQRQEEELFYKSNDSNIECLSKAISIMEEIYKTTKLSRENPIIHQLCLAYCLHALCIGKLCGSFSIEFGGGMNRSLLDESIMHLLHSLFDFLQLKGFNSNSAYLLLIDMYKRKEFSIGKRMTLLWESRRLSHPLCVSPVDIDSINKLGDDSSKVQDIVSYISYLEEKKSASIGFQQNFLFLFPNSYGSSDGQDDNSFLREITVDEVCKAARELISTVQSDSISTFLGGYLYLDLCERLVANGKLVEALSYAKEAQRLHEILFHTHFQQNVQKLNDGEHNIDFSTNIVDMNISIAKETFMFDSFSKKSSYLSHWKVLQAYLESTLQVGIICEMIGDGTEAERHLLEGEAISESLNLPLFIVGFSSILGKLYTQKAKWKLATKRITSAKKILDENERTFCCPKCKLLFEVNLLEYTEKGEEKGEEDNVYKLALDKLIEAKWEYPDSKVEAVRCICSGCNMNSSCAFNKMGCWPFLPSNLVMSRLDDCIRVKWEFIQRKLLIRLHTQLGRFLANLGIIDEANKSFLRSISLLVDKNLCKTLTCIPVIHFPHLVVSEFSRDMFVVERAELTHNICFYSWKYCRTMSNVFCDLINIKDLVSWLMHAYVLCREVPVLLQKVSKLLAVICVVSGVSEPNFKICDSPTFTACHSSAYFHQASVGTHFTIHSLSHLSARCKDSNVSGSSVTKGLLGLPNTIKDIEKHSKEVLKGLPYTTIVVMSLLENSYTDLIQEFLSCNGVKAWILISRLSSTMEPVVVLLPVYSVLQDNSVLQGKANTFKDGCSLVDRIVPDFRTLVEEHSEVPVFNDAAWNMLYKNDEHLKTFLRNLEESWFGSWKLLLQGKVLNYKNFGSKLRELRNDLKFESDVNGDLLKIVLGGSCTRENLKKKDGYIVKVGHCDEVISGILLKTSNESKEDVFQLLSEASRNLKVDGDIKREPIILVLDDEMLMMPFESMPILRKEEVYRMPSVSSIYTVLDRYSSNHKDQVERNSMSFPSIDPLDAYYLIYPDGDVPYMQIPFQQYLRSKAINLEGKAGSAPTVNQLADSLEIHDLYLYLGHNAGEEYFSMCNIEALKNCPAAILSGCSNGIITAEGSYAPTGVPLSYLLAGSPFIIATLWDVLSGQISQFTIAMYDKMWEERSNLLGYKIGAFLSQAREFCDLSYLTGGSIICYGVPTIIRKSLNMITDDEILHS